jgi:trehalose synthase
MHEVPIGAADPRRFEQIIGRKRTEELLTTADRARSMVNGHAVINVNSTAAGGGVAEMLLALLGYVKASDIDVRWLVIEGEPGFFTVTKRLHNHLYGGAGDGGALGPAERAIYEAALAPEAEALEAEAAPGDLVILHDPQTAGLAERAARRGCRVVWRCHVGIDEANERSRIGWEFLRPYLEPHVDHYVFTRAGFAPPWVPAERRTVIWPSIDPFSPKNQELSDTQVQDILTHVGILAGVPDGDRSFTRSDGTRSMVERYCDVFRTGPAADPGLPMVVQVSRWDTMKDMPGVMSAFADLVTSGLEAELVLAGPVVTAVADDPEGGLVLRECWDAWRQLPHEVRRRIQLVCIPMHDLEENAAIVNALQRHASIVTQKSLAEGFGLTVAEAMLKGTPVIGSAVGGIVDQIIDRQTGLLVDDPADLPAFGAAVAELLGDEELRTRLGAQARQRAVDVHLGDTHLKRWCEVVAATATGSGAPRLA